MNTTAGENVAIIGLGYVGQAYLKVFPKAITYDPFLPSCSQISREIVNDCKLAIICVSTPSLEEDGSCDTSIVEEVVRWLETPLILIKSTVRPGTTVRLKEKYEKRICFSPEYVGEGGYHVSSKYLHPTDVLQHPFMIIGGDQKDRADILDFFIPIFGPEKFYQQVGATTAELIKYMENSWIAMKVAFCNEFFEIAQRFGVDYNELREGWLLDPRVERSHTAVFRDNRGFNTKCIPKDVLAIAAASRDEGYVPKLIEEVLRSNDEFRKQTK